jgi:hypothetical protein
LIHSQFQKLQSNDQIGESVGEFIAEPKRSHSHILREQGQCRYEMRFIAFSVLSKLCFI